MGAVPPFSLNPALLDALRTIVGAENLQTDDYSRVKYSYGKLAVQLDQDREIGAKEVYAVRGEMARTASDILLRRTGLGTLGNPGEAVLDTVIRIAAKELNWDSATIERETVAVEKIFSNTKSRSRIDQSVPSLTV